MTDKEEHEDDKPDEYEPYFEKCTTEKAIVQTTRTRVRSSLVSFCLHIHLRLYCRQPTRYGS